MKQEESWSLSSSLSQADLEQQFQDSVSSERRAATGYLLTQGLLLLRLLQRQGIVDTRDYGEIFDSKAGARSRAQQHSAVNAGSHRIERVRLHSA